MPNNKLLLMQARKGMTALINMNPLTVEIYSRPLVDDGFGNQVEDMTDDPVKTGELKVRVSHERLSVPNDTPKPSGIDTNLGRYISSDWKNVLVAGTMIKDFDGRYYRVGPVDPLYEFGGIKGYQAPLTEGSAA